MVIWLLKSQYLCHLGGSTSQHWIKLLQKGVYALNKHSIYGAIFPIVRIHRSRYQAVKIGVALLTNTPSDPLAKILLPGPATL